MKVKTKKKIVLKVSEDELDLLDCLLCHVPTSRTSEWGHSSVTMQRMRDEIGKAVR